MVDYNTLGLIPARIGSKRLHKKNIKLLNGKPLLAYTIEAALGSNITDVVVSTDSEKIANIAKNEGAIVPFIRPEYLGNDTTTNKDVLFHAANFMEDKYSKKYESLFVLQPTSPIRKSEHIDECIVLLKNSKYDTLASVFGPIKKNQKNIKVMLPNGELKNYREGPLCEYYRYNGSIYASKRDYFLQHQNYHSGRQIGFVMDKLHSIDVDDEYDFEIAGHLLKKYKFSL